MKRPIFYADYTTRVLTAKYSSGLPDADFAVDRAAANPATYIDANGIVQIVTDSNVPRFTYGYYDATGWHPWSDSQPGLMMEGASTNMLVSGTIDTNCAWTSGPANNFLKYSGTTRWYMYLNAAAGATTTNSISADSRYLRSMNIAVTGQGLAPTDIQFMTNDAISIINGTIYTISFWIKTSVSKIIPIIFIKNVPPWTNYGLNTTFTTVANTWIRVVKSFTANATVADGSMRIYFGLLGTFEIYMESFQMEAFSFASSFIPTTTVALTRNAETLKYRISGNRSVSVESCVAKIVTGWPDSTFNNKVITNSDTKRRIFYFPSLSQRLNMFPNYSDSLASTLWNLIDAPWAANAEMTLGYIVQHLLPYAAGYYNGVPNGTPEITDDFIDPVWGTYFWVGSKNDGTQQLNGVIKKIAFFDEVLSDSDMANLHNYDNWGWRFGLGVQGFARQATIGQSIIDLKEDLNK